MPHFVNIKTNEEYKYNDWDEIISIGGLRNIFRKDYDDIYEIKACIETTNQVMSFMLLSDGMVRINCKNMDMSVRDAKEFIKPYIEALSIVNKKTAPSQ